MKSTSTSKINSGTILLGFFAILVGLIGTYTVRLALAAPPVVQQEPPPPPKPPARTTVPLASRDIAAGTTITLDDIALYRLTQDEIKESIKVKSFMTNPDQIIGKVLSSDLKRNDPFDTRHLLPAGKVPGVAGRLTPGLRAVTVAMTPDNALLGFAGPGQRVDVLFHYGAGDESVGAAAGTDVSDLGFRPGHHDFNAPRRRDYHGNTIGGGAGGLGSSEFQNATSTLIQDAEILALGHQSTPTDLASPIEGEEQVRVTLAVTPRQAEMLRVASGHGTLSLTMRSPEDEEKLALVDPVTLDHILAVDNTVHVMEIYRGQRLSKVQFGSDHSIRTRVFDEPEAVAEKTNQAEGESTRSTPVGKQSSGNVEPIQ
ncbi:Flp pilus assembly protein CpaB [Stieleria varia]|uniref:SAF domain protein n=1 Tax=Stieleria varia TaxID=2528005 RepID=A0A5C6B187_9BACT|nr:Flp pilus assembly protein CpaB [Stieleria varia]TWU06075.1 SAF domain protein [Stieleria varia]